MSYLQRTEIKMNQLREDIKTESNFEKKLIYLINLEFDSTLNDILLIEPDTFMDRIEKNISFSLENLYSEKCLSDQKLISIIDKLIEMKKTEYSDIAKLLRNTWNINENSKTNIQINDNILTNFRKHCINSSNIAKHNCRSQNADFLLVKNNQNKIDFVICKSCKKVYYSSYILCNCEHCNIDYYTNILNDNEDSNLMLATWEKYHCPIIINEKMKCIQCKEYFYINMETGMLTCLNKNCKYETQPNKITWTCKECQKDFKSNAIPYNPLEIKMVTNTVRQTLLLKHRAHPNNLPCCKLNVFFVEFFHKKICRGVLYEGELNNKMIIVCDKCHAINYYEGFIWTCPKCLRKFKDNNNIANNREENDIKIIKKFNNPKRRQSKYSSAGKNYKIKNDKNEITSGKNIINTEKETLEDDCLVNNYFIEEIKNKKKMNLKLGFDLLPKGSGYFKKENVHNSEKINNSNIKQNQSECIKITINNESGKKINNFIINNNNISVYYSKHNNEKNSKQNHFLRYLNNEQFVSKFSGEDKNDYKRKQKNNKNHHIEYISIYKKRSASTCMDSNIEKKYMGNYLKNIENEVSKPEILKKNVVSNKNINVLKKRNYSIENIYHGRDITPKKNQLQFVKVEYNVQKRRNRHNSVGNNRESESKIVESLIEKNKNNYKYFKNKLDKKSQPKESEETTINNRKNMFRFHSSINGSNEKKQNEYINIRLKKFINLGNNQNNNNEVKDKINNNSIKGDNEENKNKIENNNDLNIIQEYKNKNINNYNYKEIIVKKNSMEDTEQKDNTLNNINKKENNDFQYIPENIGLQNLEGISEKLLIHLKLRINNIFSKSKLPIFNIEDYILIRQIGEGTFGIIYSVIKKSENNKEYALKKIIAKSINEVNAFLQEFELVYSCEHPNILKIFGFCLRILDNTTFALYVLMEKSKCDWEKEIKSHLTKGKYYTEKELINIMKQLCEALLFLKNKLNISHRDIKPQNVLVFNGNIYKLADFGEAKQIKISKKLNTLRGTELYMSPALYNGLKHDKIDVSHDSFKSDVFSLGFCFLYAGGLNFNLLFQLRDITNNEILEEKINEHLLNNYSKNFVIIVSSMLKIDELKRFGFKEILEFINKNYQ